MTTPWDWWAPQHRTPESMFQHYWRCAHHPSAIQNFFEQRNSCEWCCEESRLLWHHGGEHPQPRSWGGPF